MVEAPMAQAPSSEINLLGRKVLVTGGARGLGLAFAQSLVAAGARVVISDILDDLGLKAAADLGPNAHYIGINMADQASINNGVSQAAQWLGGIDGLINNAAVTNSGGKDMQDITNDTWDRVMAVNVRGVWQCSVAATPYLAASGSGRIVNLASDTALWGAPRLMAYVASKGAIIAMTKSMARELASQHITVNAIAPGLTLVEATQYVPQARHEHYANGRAIERAQLPSDVTGAALFLLSHTSGFITGQILPVNGGFYMN